VALEALTEEVLGQMPLPTKCAKVAALLSKGANNGD